MIRFRLIRVCLSLVLFFIAIQCIFIFWVEQLTLDHGGKLQGFATLRNLSLQNHNDNCDGESKSYLDSISTAHNPLTAILRSSHLSQSLLCSMKKKQVLTQKKPKETTTKKTNARLTRKNNHDHLQIAQVTVTVTATPLPRVLAIYFPQYHRDPLNDKNWGEGFTDWVSLKNAPAKNVLGYAIPRPTSELGYYNLNEVGPRKRQGELAKQHGIDGFIYHHYWFYDKEHPGPNLAQPLLNMLQDGHPDMPFFLNWCAVKWINVWMGRAIFQKIPTNRNRALTLQEQYFNVTDEEIKQHYDWLSPFFHHPKYIRVENQPVFFTYYHDDLALPILQRLRKYAMEDGFDGLYLMVGRSAMPDHIYKPPKDLEVVWQEQMMRTMQSLNFLGMDNKQFQSSIYNQSMTYPYPLQYITRTFTIPQWCLAGTRQKPGWPLEDVGSRQRRPEIPGVISTFDNSPRRPDKEAKIFLYGPKEEVVEKFRKNLYAAIYYQTCCLTDFSDDRFVAINSWNEWGEGMAIEPSDVYGMDFLETIRDVKAHIAETGCNGVPADLQGDPMDTNQTADEIRAALIKETNWLNKPMKRGSNQKFAKSI